MDAKQMFSKIKELGRNNNKGEELREYCKLNSSEIFKCLPKRIVYSDGGDILDFVWNGLRDCSTPSNLNIKLLETVLQTLREVPVCSTRHCSDVINRLCLKLPKVPLSDVLRWCDDSIQSIIQDNDVNLIWRDVLPECMNVIMSYNSVTHCGTEMSSSEYKEQCIRTLCQCRWTEKQLVQLTVMFIDLQVPRNDHKQVVNKICSYITDIVLDTLPPLVYQLLKLCNNQNLEIVLSHLSQFFSVRVYSKLEPPPQDSESTTMDIDDIVQYSPEELSSCLSNCLYHFVNGAIDPHVIQKALKQWPKSQLLRTPFLIDIALDVSTMASEFKPCLDVIKSAIEQRLMDEVRCNESAWVRSVIPPDVDIVSVLKVLTADSLKSRQLTPSGLIELAFSLLAVNKVKPTAAQCWSYGNLLLVRLCRYRLQTTRILGLLSDRLAGDAIQTQYAECLYLLCKETPTIVNRTSKLGTIIENCRPSTTDYKTAAAVLEAVHPMFNISAKVSDTMFMVCRKGLYSRDSLQRRVALCGFLTMLRQVKVSRETCSQSTSDMFSTYSYLTQIAVDHHTQPTEDESRNANFTLCMEIISVIRRCLSLDAAVRQLLYTGLYTCSKEKTSVHEAILESLYEHLAQYLPDDQNRGELLIDKCVQLTPVTAVLIEPIGHLLYVICQFLQSTEEDLEDILLSQNIDTGSAYLKSKLANIIDQLCIVHDFGNIDMDDVSLTDLTPESKAKSLKVQQILQCYEALIAYKIFLWSPTSKDVANEVYNLFKACNQLLELTKAPSKSRKGNKSADDTRDTAKTNKSQKSQNEKTKNPTKLSNLVKDRAGPFKALPSLWDLSFCLRITELFYAEEVAWSSQSERNQLRSRRDFHHWSLRCILSVLAEGEFKKRSVVRYVIKMATVIYKRCICRFQDMCDFDDYTTLLCVDLFRNCLNILFSKTYCLKIQLFLPEITVLPEATPTVCIAEILEKIHSALVQVESESDIEERDAVLKSLVSGLLQVAGFLLDRPLHSCTELCAVIIKVEDYIRSSKQDCLSLIPSVLAANCREQQEAQIIDDLLVKLASALGKIDEEESSVVTDDSHFPYIDSRSGHTALSHVCFHLNTRFKHLEHLLARAKDLTAAVGIALSVNQLRIDRELKELYKSIVIQLCQLTTWTSSICKLCCCVGGGSDRVLVTVVRLYTVLAIVAKQMDAGTAHLVRFERLLKLCGKKFSTVTANLITYVEASQHQQSASKVIRDTKIIPRMVLATEQFYKQTLLLDHRAKTNFQQYLSMGTVRDFRIKAPVLQEVLHADDRDDEEADNQDESPNISATSNDESDEDAEKTSKKQRVS